MPNFRSGDEKMIKRPPFDSLAKEVTTPRGIIYIRGPLSSSDLKALTMSDELNCFRPVEKQRLALIELAAHPDGLIFVASAADNRQVVGYMAFQQPDFPWWEHRCFPELLELSAMETALSWRNSGVSRAMLNAVFASEFSYFEDYIVFTIQSVDNWDLQGSGLDPWSYRRLMLNMLRKSGFTKWETVDPECREHLCNLLLARIGKNISPHIKEKFACCCMGAANST